MTKLSPKAVKEKLEKNEVCFLDVRSQDEFLSGHVPGARCVPLEDIQSGKAEIPRDQLVVLSCQSGRRSAAAREALMARGFTNLTELEGGFSAWASDGLPVNRQRKSIPVIRQVMMVAGALVLAGASLGWLVSPAFLVIPVFMGAGLLFAGTTGWCGLAFLLERMPWNRVG